jgi:hypothetical protein
MVLTTFAQNERLRTRLATVLDLSRAPLRAAAPVIDLLVRLALAKAFFAPGMFPGIGAARAALGQDGRERTSRRRRWASSRRSGSHRTPRWSKGDSNRGSHPGFHRSRQPVPDEERRHRARLHRCIRRQSASRPSGVNIAAIRTALRRCRRLVLNDHAYDKMTGWSNMIPVVPVKGDATETYKFIKEESHGTRSTPHR